MSARRGTTLSETAQEYQEAMASEGQAKATLAAKRSILAFFVGHVGNIQTRNVTRRHVDTYFAMRQARGIKPASLNNELRIIRHYFNWCIDCKYLGAHDNPIGRRRDFKVQKKDMLRVPPERFAELLDASTERDRIANALGLFACLRQSEIRSLKVGDVDLSTGYLDVIVHKTKDYDKVPILLELKRELERWLRYYKVDQGVTQLDPNWYLVPAKRGNQFTGVGRRQLVEVEVTGPVLKPLQQMWNVEDCAKRALGAMGYELRDSSGRSTGLGCHTLRRSGARAIYDVKRKEEGFDGALRLVQQLLHHASQTTTEIYLGETLDKKMRDDQLRLRPLFEDSGTDAAVIPFKIAEGE